MTKLRHIAVNTRLLLPGGLEGIGRFSYEVLRLLAEKHPETRFSFFFDRKYDEQFIFGSNVEAHVLFPQARHPFLFIWWFEYSVAARLRKLKPDVFFSPDGYLSLRSKVPQVPVFHDLAFEHFPGDVKKLEAWHYRKYFPRYAQKAARILTVSEFTKRDIQKQYGTDPGKIDVCYNGVSARFSPVDPGRKTEIRQKFSQGKPYFHCVGAIQPRKNLSSLIQAFNRFKTEQSSDVQLLVVGRKAWNFEEVISSYKDSPFKDEIHFTGFVSDADLNDIYGASEALCYVPYFEGFGIPILEAMQCDCPVITSRVTSMPEVAGDAAILVDPREVASIVAAMQEISPQKQEALIQAGRERLRAFSWEKTASQVWQTLEHSL